MSENHQQLTLHVGARTERGRREENQDQMSGFASGLGSVYLVADGMGGHSDGALAARVTADGFRKHLAKVADIALNPETNVAAILQAVTTTVNQEMMASCDASAPQTRRMGSTVVLVAALARPQGMEFVVGHIGDSRAYMVRAGRLTRLTVDHSIVQQLLVEGLVTPSEAIDHPDTHVLTRALGQYETVDLEILSPQPLLANDRIILCTDGLWGYIPDEMILSQTDSFDDPADLANSLVDLALARGSDDNVTIQVLYVEPPPKVEFL